MAAVLPIMSACVPWAGFVPRSTVVLPASDLGAAPRRIVSWETTKKLPGYGGYPYYGQYEVVTEMRPRKDGSVVVLSGEGVRFLDSAGRLERTERFAVNYLWSALFRAAGGLWVAGLHGPDETRELHAFPLGPLGERTAKLVWACRRCFGLAAVDFAGNGLDSLVALGPQAWESNRARWQYRPPHATGMWIFNPPSKARRLAKPDHDAKRIAALDLDGDGREEIVLHPIPWTNGYLYNTERISVLRGDGNLQRLMDTDRNKNRSFPRLRRSLTAPGRGGYVPVRPGPGALFAKVSLWSMYLHLADPQGRVLASHRLPADITLRNVVGWHEVDGATIIVLTRPHACEFPVAPCGSLVLELTPAGELREIARHEGFVTASTLTRDGHLLAAEHQWESAKDTTRRTVVVRDYGSMRQPR